MTTARHEIVVFGATSFVGQILCRYLIEQSDSGERLGWAMAGRSAAKLEALRNSLGASAAKVPLIVADAADEAALGKLCASTRVVISTVGPYALYGEPLVRLCAENGTDYCDLTGEVQWIRRMIERYAPVEGNGMGVWIDAASTRSVRSRRAFSPAAAGAIRRAVLAQDAGQGQCAAVSVGGHRSPSTDELRQGSESPIRNCAEELRIALSAGGDRECAAAQRSPSPNTTNFETWVAPFVMAAINTRIVHRRVRAGSSKLMALAGRQGCTFRADEAVPGDDALPHRRRHGLVGFGATRVAGTILWRYVSCCRTPARGPARRCAARGLL